MKYFSKHPDSWKCRLKLGAVPKDGTPYTDSWELSIEGGIKHWGLEYIVEGPISSSVEVARNKENFIAEISVRASVSVSCARCLEKTRVATEAVLRYLYTLRPADGEDRQKKEENDGDIPEVEQGGDYEVITVGSYDDVVDLAFQMWETLIVSLPSIAYCRDDCLGLCPVCGSNRNDSECSCGGDKTDPRFDALKSFKPD